MIATIQDIQPTSTGTGSKVILGDGTVVYVFNQQFFNLIHVGATVDLSLSRRGRYTHVIGVAPANYGASQYQSPQPTYQPPQTAYNPPPPAYVQPPQPQGTRYPQPPQAPTTAAPQPGFTNQPPAPMDKDSMICRQAILKSPVLVELYKDLPADQKGIAKAIELCQRLENYVFTGD